MVNIKREDGTNESLKQMPASSAIDFSKVTKADDTQPDVLTTAAKIAGGTGIGLAGAGVIGEGLKRSGKALYTTNLPPTADEARALQSYDAGVSKSKPRIATDVAIEMPLIQKGGRSTSSKLGGVGTREMIGEQTQARANNIFKDVINPIFKKAEDTGISFNFENLKKNILDRVKNAERYSVQMRKDIAEDVTALFDDMKGETGLKNLDQLKKEVVNKVPQKYLKTGAAPSPYSLSAARKIVAKEFRDNVHSTIKDTFDVESAKLYQDYNKLKGLSEIGVKARTQAGRKGGSGTFISWLTDTLATPITTATGKGLYKTGEALQAIPKKVFNSIKEVIKKPNVKALLTTAIKQAPAGLIGDMFGQEIGKQKGEVYQNTITGIEDIVKEIQESGDFGMSTILKYPILTTYIKGKSEKEAIAMLEALREEMGERPEDTSTLFDYLVQ